MKGTWIATHSPSKEYIANYDRIFNRDKTLGEHIAENELDYREWKEHRYHQPKDKAKSK